MAKDVIELAEEIEKLEPEEKAIIMEIIESGNSWVPDITNFLNNQRMSEKRVCPICGSEHTVKNGKRSDGVQRYHCKECNHYFVMSTNSILFGTRKDLSAWIKFIECSLDNNSLKLTAEKCGIHKNTALNWRHKLQESVSTIQKEKLSGVIEMDEAYQDISYKGNHSNNKDFIMPREPRKRGSESTKRGLSSDKVCIPCAVSENGIAEGKIAKCGAVSYEGLSCVFGKERISELSTIVSDDASSYIRLAEDCRSELIQIPTGQHVLDGYNIQKVNSFHTSLKNLINHVYRGVSTKHLNGYIAWTAFTFKKNRLELKIRLLKLLASEFFDTVRNILLHPIVPVLVR